jgi:hypothetical protein
MMVVSPHLVSIMLFGDDPMADVEDTLLAGACYYDELALLRRGTRNTIIQN